MMKAVLFLATLAGLSLRGDMIPEAIFGLYPDDVVSGVCTTRHVDVDTTPDRRHDFRRYVDASEMYAVRDDGARTNVTEVVSDTTNLWTYVDADTNGVYGTYVACAAWTNGAERGYYIRNLRSDMWDNWHVRCHFDLDVMRLYVVTGWTDRAYNYAVDAPTDRQDADALACIGSGCTQKTWMRACYGSAWSVQVRRAIAERARAFGEPANEVAMMAKCDARNVPCLPPGSDVRSYRVWAATGKAPYSKGMVVTASGRQFYSTNAVDALVEEYGRRVNARVSIPGPSLADCRASDAATNSYSLFPIGIALHHADDAAEELGHFFNFCWPVETNRCTTFRTPGGNYVTSWNEFCAAYHGLKVDAWGLGIDLGVEGGATSYVYRLEHPLAVTDRFLESCTTIDYSDGIETRIPPNALRLLRVYQEAREMESEDAEKIRAWFDSSAVGRLVL